jgi:hypothetical protein
VRQLGVPAAQQKAEEEDDDRRPKSDTAPPTTKREWKSSIALMKKTNALTEYDASAPFRVSEFPACLLHAEADLKPKKAFKEASLRRNVAGACGLVFVRCGEMAFSSLGKDSTVMTRLNGAISRDSTQDVESLLQVLKDTREDLLDICKGLGGIANVGSSIAAGSFNQGIEDIRHLVWESLAAKSIRPTLKLCPPSLTHLFGDEARIKEALEVDRCRSYQATPFHSRPYANPRSSPQEQKVWPKRRSTPYKKSKGGSRNRPAGKANGPASKKGEGQKRK